MEFTQPNHSAAAAARTRVLADRCRGCGTVTGDLDDGLYCAECVAWEVLWLDERADEEEARATA